MFKGLNNYKKTIAKKGADELKKVTILAFETMVTRSPVDTGRFRGNWKGGIERVDLSVDEAGQEGAQRGAALSGREVANMQGAIGAKIGQDVYISNNLKYAQGLENGRSPQAPGGVLHITQREIQSKLG